MRLVIRRCWWGVRMIWACFPELEALTAEGSRRVAKRQLARVRVLCRERAQWDRQWAAERYSWDGGAE